MKKRNWKKLAAFGTVGCAIAQLATPAHAAPSSAYKGPSGMLSRQDNQDLWSRYCVGEADSAAIPGVNYANEDVQAAARKLSKVADLSFYYYSPIVTAYQLRDAQRKLIPAPADAPAGTTPNAHAFLVQLCGEFRDRATMVRAKIGWVKNLFVLPNAPQQEIDVTKNVWSQVSAHSYGSYLQFSAALWEARKRALSVKGENEWDFRVMKTVKLGNHEVEMPVEGTTVCETKYILAKYVSKRQPFPGLDQYNQGLAEFKKAGCTKEDNDYYYDFRGDSNFKPNSPEANGMIWYATSIAKQCATTTQARPQIADATVKVTDAECESYFRNPFRSRWNAARAGLASWLFRDRKHDGVFSETSRKVTIIPDANASKEPFSFRVDQGTEALREFMPEWSAIPNAYSRSDIGFNLVCRLSRTKDGEDLAPDFGLTYERLRDAVNRHTDWYASAYDDGLSKDKPRDQAYSPFVASSYEMSKSDGFTAPGATVNSPSDGRKHWMFVFRVKRSNWYNSEAIAKGRSVNFDTMWFDETSLGTNHLAKSERAWDRLGTALESELDSILYLHNISTYGEVVGNE